MKAENRQQGSEQVLPEGRKRAVRLVFDHEGLRGSR